jgi:hypothetical protein
MWPSATWSGCSENRNPAKLYYGSRLLEESGVRPGAGRRVIIAARFRNRTLPEQDPQLIPE